PENVVIALAGNLPKNFLQLIESFFQDYTSQPFKKADHTPVFTPNVKIKQKSTEQTHVCIGLPGLPIDDPRIYQVILLNTILGGNMSSRLFQKIREEKSLAYSVFSYHSSYQKAGLF